MGRLGRAAAAGLLALMLAAAARSAEVRYNEVQVKASHNSYAQAADIVKQLGEWKIRCIEFDLHTKKGGLLKKEPAPAGDFFVYHTQDDQHSNCGRLSECLAQVKAFHDQQPEHEVVTIFFDMAGVGEPGHTRDELYGLLRNGLPPGSIFTPGDLMRACPAARDLQAAVTAPGCAWPAYASLNGKFILVVSDGREALKQAGYDLATDLMFIVSKSSDPARMFDDKDVVFFNMSGASDYAKTVRAKGFVARCYWLNRQEQYDQAKSNGANLLATDRIDPAQFPWANTAGPRGEPYLVRP
jgi:hypothetical protein